MDVELSDVGFMAALQWASVLKVIVSSRCLSNYRDLFNLHHLIRRWYSATHTFILFLWRDHHDLRRCGQSTIATHYGNMDSNDIELSAEEEVVKAKLKKGMSGNTKLSY